MSRVFMLSVIALCAPAFSQVPDPVITGTDANNGYATIAGRLKGSVNDPVGISVRNGNIMYATMSDPQGKWAIVIRHLSTSVDVTSWDARNPSDVSTPVRVTIK